MLGAGSAGVAATAFGSLGGQLEPSTIGGLPNWRDIDRISKPTGVPLLLGWSANDIDWGWQSLPDTFGVTEGEPWAQLAVGRDFVIARVETIVSPTSEEIASWRDDPSANEEFLTMEGASAALVHRQSPISSPGWPTVSAGIPDARRCRCRCWRSAAPCGTCPAVSALTAAPDPAPPFGLGARRNEYVRGSGHTCSHMSCCRSWAQKPSLIDQRGRRQWRCRGMLRRSSTGE